MSVDSLSYVIGVLGVIVVALAIVVFIAAFNLRSEARKLRQSISEQQRRRRAACAVCFTIPCNCTEKDTYGSEPRHAASRTTTRNA